MKVSCPNTFFEVGHDSYVRHFVKKPDRTIHVLVQKAVTPKEQMQEFAVSYVSHRITWGDPERDTVQVAGQEALRYKWTDGAWRYVAWFIPDGPTISVLEATGLPGSELEEEAKPFLDSIEF